jgi:hypothetical protein
VKDQDKTTSRGLVLRPSRRQSENEKRGDDEEENATLVGVEATSSPLELSVAYEETQELARLVPAMCEHIIQFVKYTDASCKAAKFFYEMCCGGFSIFGCRRVCGVVVLEPGRGVKGKVACKRWKIRF